MKFLNMHRMYMSPEVGASTGGGESPQVDATTEAETPAEPTPAVEPVDTPKDTPKESPKETKEEPKEAPKDKSDDSKLNRVTSLIEDAGLDMKEVAEYAKANEGKVDLDTLVALKEKHGEAIADIIAEQIKSIHAERTSEAAKRDQDVYDQVAESFKDTTDQSGEETWKELAGWAKENVSKEHRAEINKLLTQGGLATKLAVQELAAAFKESQGKQEYQNADLMEADSTGKSSGGDITKQDYNMELNKLLKAGHQYGSSSEINKLDARRLKSIQRGY
jgi:hypothetical protein